MSDVVLIVESELPMQARLFRILIMLGYTNDMIICTCNVAQAKEMAGRHRLRMALVDPKLINGNAVELIGWLRSIGQSLPILVVSASSAEEEILDALRAGASGYLLRERDDIEIAISIKNALEGGVPIDPFLTRRILSLVNNLAGEYASPEPEVPERLPCGLLSKRELTVLTQVAQGMSNREIAEALSVSRWTVDTHIRRIYTKLSVNSRTQALRAARLQGLVH